MLSDSSVHVSGNGCDAFFNGSDALNLSPVQIFEALVQKRQEQKHPNGAEVNPAFSSIFTFQLQMKTYLNMVCLEN